MSKSPRPDLCRYALRHDGQGRFVSNDGLLAMSFELDAQGQARNVRLTAPAGWA